MRHDPWGAILGEVRRAVDTAASILGCPSGELAIAEARAGKGDVAIPVFTLAKSLRRGPEELAAALARAVPRGGFVAEARCEGGYVNLDLDAGALANATLASVRAMSDRYGEQPRSPLRILLEHTSVNPTGPVHVGRARNPIIGDSLARILRYAGFAVTTEYLVNDLGKQMVLLYWGVTHLKPDDVRPAASSKEDHRLVPYYVKANELAEADPAVGPEVEELIRRFEGGDDALTREISTVAKRVLAGILETLERIGVAFDRFFWESSLILQGKVATVTRRLTALPEAAVEDGAPYIDMAPFGVKGRDTKWFLTKRDGTSLYPTRDVAYHLDKLSRCDVAINVLGENHRLEFEQLQTALRLLRERDVEAVFYSYVVLPEGGMSTRRDRVVTMDDLIDEAVDRATKEVRKRRDDLSAEATARIAEVVGIGALRFNVVRVQAEKKIVFRWEDALNFEGNSAPFVQYAHARMWGILDKAGTRGGGDPALLQHPQEFRLLKLLAKFPSTVRAAAEARAPNIVAGFAADFAAQFNQFYRDCPVIQAEEPLRSARLELVDASRIVLSSALDCLGIAAPREM